VRLAWDTRGVFRGEVYLKPEFAQHIVSYTF